jgi:hypothetical protein
MERTVVHVQLDPEMFEHIQKRRKKAKKASGFEPSISEVVRGMLDEARRARP